MHRVLISSDALQRGTAILADPREIHHLVRVLRAKPGDSVECFDGAGQRAWGTIGRCSAREVVIALSRCQQDAAPSLHVTLAQALIRVERFEWAIEKATELGVDRIVPLLTQRVTVRMRAEGADRKRARWERIAREAAKQCGRARLPVVDAVQPFDVFAATLEPGRGVILLATLEVPTRPLAEALEPMGERVTLLIGPEGDFTRDEALVGQRHGAILVSLGSHTLRAETASLAALAMVRYQQMIMVQQTRKGS